MKSLLAVLAFTAAALAAGQAEAKFRPVRCVVDAAGAPRWAGPCQFEAARGGSFTIRPVRGTFQNGARWISLNLLRPGFGEVRGMTNDGINSRWGEARRSPRDRACWIGADFSLCVY